MALCPSCGQENPEQFRFCGACGAPLIPGPGLEPTRRTVTVVFCDLAGSTELGERLDPESLRDVMSNYFDLVATALERHGGTVEKFIGDAVMAVFGVPQLHEDDALRAVRAVAEIHDQLARFNDDLRDRWHIRLHIRTGVNTGEVISGDAATDKKLVTGDAVNVAARLQQAAEADETLIGDGTYVLVRDEVRVEQVPPLELKGKSAPVTAWRLVEALPEVPAFTRPLGTAFVGRTTELGVLEQGFRDAVEHRSCQLRTVVGPPGIGKSRLARELITGVGARAHVVIGRCLPYGEGITYWPLTEIVRQVAGTDARAGLEQWLDDENTSVIAERIAGAVGATESAGPAEETFWAFRKLFEALARRRPLIAIVDDIHWAEPTLLDLLEYILTFASDAPILLLCLARPDLFDRRPSWATPRPHADLITIGPLADEDAYELVGRLVRGRAITPDALSRTIDVAEGNPLFVEQLLALQTEDGRDGELAIPPTIQALLSARIDQLQAEERAVLERASVEGRMFHRGAVAELLDAAARPSLGTHLMALIRKEFIRPDRSLFAGDDGFRFGHILIRDAAYQSISKQLRAELHEKFAAWLEGASGDRVREYEEILGYHLEQSFRLREDLGAVDERAHGLAVGAAKWLAAAGARATDPAAKLNLLGRARALPLPKDTAYAELLQEFAGAVYDSGDLAECKAVLKEALGVARALADERLTLRAEIDLAGLAAETDPDYPLGEWGGIVERAIPVFESLGDTRGLVRCYSNLWAFHCWNECQFDRARAAADRGLEHAKRSGDESATRRFLSCLAQSTMYGRTPAEQGIRRCEELLKEAGELGTSVAWIMLSLGVLLAMQTRFKEARSLADRGRRMLTNLGHHLQAANLGMEAGQIELLAGDPIAAERVLREGYEGLSQAGETGRFSTLAARLGEAMYAQGRDEEAEEASRVSEEAAADADLMSQTMFRALRAKVFARRGDCDRAERLAREALQLAARLSEAPNVAADTAMALAEVLRVCGRSEEAGSVIEGAVRLYEQKGNVVSAAKARALLDELAIA